MKYEVLKVDGKSGLTVGSVIKPGGIFDESQWPYGKEALDAAVKNKRCKEIGEKKAKESKGDKDK